MTVKPDLLLAFLAGVVTVVTPCVLPILPPLLAGSVGSRARPLLIVLGSSVTFTLMGGLFSAIGIAGSRAGNVMRIFFTLLIIALGAAWADEEIGELFTRYTSMALAAIRGRASSWRGDGWAGAFLLGLSLGIVWIPCVGPILGAVLSYAAIKGNLFYGSALLFTYSLGLGIPMLGIAYGGKSVAGRLEWTRRNSSRIKKAAGWVLVLTGISMLLGISQYLQSALLPYFPELETRLLTLLQS